MKVDIISRELIKPSSPTPTHLKTFNLSFIDQVIPPTYFPLHLHYLYDETTNITQPQMSHRLKQSLSDVLTLFYPLAGKMAGESSIDCNDQGVLYTEAHIDTDLKNIIKSPQVEVLDELIPYKLDGSQIINVEHQLAIQVNLFICGGIVIGICISHKMADLSSLSTFLQAWASMSQGSQKFVAPILNLSTFFPPRYVSNYIRQPKKQAISSTSEVPITKRFVFTATAIAALKAKVAKESHSLVPATRVEVLSALIWKCCLDVQKPSNYKVAFHTVNLRGRLVPPLPETTYGNLFLMARAETEGKSELSFLVGKLRDSFKEIGGDCLIELLGENGFEVLKRNFREVGKLLSQESVEILRFSSWCRFPFYDADFGWGKPTWVSIGSTPNKDCVFFLDSRCDEGMEVWLVLDQNSMSKFELHPDFQSHISLSPST